MRLVAEEGGSHAAGGGDLLLRTTDLSNHLHCAHLTSQSLAVATEAEAPPPRYEDPGAELLRRKGDQHEARVLARFRAQGLAVVDVQPPRPEGAGASKGTTDWYAAGAAATLAAMRAGADVIYQGVLFDGTWHGRPDFLRRVQRPSPVLGDWSYEVIDAKLARQAKAAHILQIALYSELLTRAQGVEPEGMGLVLGGPEPREERYLVSDYAAYHRLVRRRFDDHLGAQRRALGERDAVSTYPEPCEHCVLCDWRPVCTARWRHDDHLSLVAGISRRQRAALEEREISTLEALGDQPVPLEPPLEGSSPKATERVQRQARIQLQARRDGDGRYELLTPVVPGEGLAALTEPSPGDLFLDFESDRFHEHMGLEYLLGYCDVEGEYTALWALDRAQERAVFEEFEREVELRDASTALHQLEAFLELRGDEEELRAIQERVAGYNRDDCVSTLRLRAWLEELREELAEATGAEVPRPAPEEKPSGGETVSEIAARVAELEARLTADLPAETGEGAPLAAEHTARRLLARLLDFHRREEKAMWWEYFTRCDMSEDELIEDRSALGGLEYVAMVGKAKRSLIHRYRFPEQEHALSVGDRPHDATARAPAAMVHAIDDRNGWIDLKRGQANEMPERLHLVPLEHFHSGVLRESLLRLAEVVLADGLGATDRTRVAADLLLRRPPSLTRGSRDDGGAGPEPGTQKLMRPEEDELAAAKRLVRDLDRSMLAVQGPPGSGKTYTGARVIAALLADGKRVGVTRTSHKVIGNLLGGG